MNNEYLQLESAIVDTLRGIYDPEIPVNIYDMGLIYQVNVDPDNRVEVVMTLTAPNCPVADSLPLEVRDRIALIDKVKDVEVTLTFDPPWSKEMLSDEARLELGMF
jgi:FeS assembly SUF system protein